MKKIGLIALSFFVVPSAMAEGAKGTEDAKVMSGLSIQANDEAPKSLYIVPWKGSEAGMETELASSLLNDGMVPVDKDVFMRQLDFYEISKAE